MLQFFCILAAQAGDAPWSVVVGIVRPWTCRWPRPDWSGIYAGYVDLPVEDGLVCLQELMAKGARKKSLAAQ
eukprot:10515045-Lingulodinium_polyedra.AAC.1